MDPENPLNIMIFYAAIVLILGGTTILCNFIESILDEHDRLKAENEQLRKGK
ncbi:hypothetical protein [Bacillus manliponensis]|uniref:hypothetical protein n=1 Tax=Bacillus manliponensis TaxID=574376 RepID=UPI000B298A13|nr:hypothetical protein [Bacillus manliponensis]